jgi:predicted RNA-binding Zn-ribbon protein involved in translation (DUF1610 family)
MQSNRYSHGIALNCPHCGKRVIIRTSRLITEIYREAWGICPACGFNGKAHVAWDVEAAGSLMPNPKVTLPKMDFEHARADFLSEELRKRPQVDLFESSG